MAAEWFCYLFMRTLGRSGFEPETLAFFLTTLGVEVCATSTPDDMLKEVILIIAGVALYFFLGWWLRDLERVKKTRWLAAAAALGLLALNLLMGEVRGGSMNWLEIGGFTIQPSELVKVCYIYAGAATLDRLFARRNLFGYIVFSAVCVCALALMGDFGTAVIFFATFLVVSFMRSGSFATVLLAVSGAGLAGFLVLSVKPYIAQRFATWGHAWEDVWDAGFQQTRAMSAAASGGLFGQGAGEGWLKDIVAANTDMVFAVLSEELGLIMAVTAMLAVIALALFRRAQRLAGAQHLLCHRRLRRRQPDDGADGPERVRLAGHPALHGRHLPLRLQGRHLAALLLDAAGLRQGHGHAAQRQLRRAPRAQRAAEGRAAGGLSRI